MIYITRINGLAPHDTAQYMQHMTAELAHQLGVKEMALYRYNCEAESEESLNARMDGIIAGIRRGDLVICQFPTGNGLRFEQSLMSHLRAYGGRAAVFLQDLEPLHSEEKRNSVWELVSLYNQAEVMIVPSLAMRQFLLDCGIKKEMKFVIQEMWDDAQSVMPREEREETSADLAEGRFGLVWYQDMGELKYMESGISFSLARFLAAGIPVVIPVGISEEKMVEKNHLGLVVHSPEEAADRTKEVSETEYQEYVRCVEQFAPALQNGYYTKKCLLEAMQAFYRKDVGNLSVPEKVYQLETPEFTYTILNESYGGNLALSWVFHGDTDGFLIYDDVGTLVGETDNIHRHYCRIKGYGAERRFCVKAYVETLKGKLIVAESGLTRLAEERYEFPRVSLVIPAYHAQDYVSRSIDTALAQSFPDLQIIVVDDGSTDRTGEILDWYEEKYPNVIAIHQENAGPAAARNTGINRADGEYIAFMDNDDMIHPDMVAKLYQSAEKNGCDIAVTSIYQINKNGCYEGLVRYPLEQDIAISTYDFFQMHFTTGHMFVVLLWNKLYRTSIVKEHLIPNMIGDDDAWTPYILSYADKICYLDGLFYEWDRKIRSSTLVDKWESRSKEEIFQTYRNIILFYLTYGNKNRRKLIKQLAGRQISEMKRVFAYEEYGKLWDEIEEKF